MPLIKKHLKLVVLGVVGILVIAMAATRTTIKTDGYNPDNVYKTIEELSSDKYKGRRYGTKENMEAVKYVERQFQSIGLKPAGENGTYMRNYPELTRSYNGVAVLEITDNLGRVIKSYRYGEDFIEQGYSLSGPGEISSGFDFLKYSSGVMYDKFHESRDIAIVREVKTSSMELEKLYVALGEADYKALISVVPDDVNLRRESSNVLNARLEKTGYEIPSLIAKEKVIKEFEGLRSNGNKIHLQSTFDVNTAPVADVFGMIPGKGNDYLFITSHIDNVGPGSDGTIYPGALDNASGVAAMLEIARYIKSQGKTPQDNIVFIAFNAKEGGMWGSSSYVRRPLYPLYRTTVLNLDMLGAKEKLPISLVYNKTHEYWSKRIIDPSLKLKYHLNKLATAMGYEVNEMEANNSDHAYFNAFGVSGVTLMENDESVVQTPMDTMDNISKENLDRVLGLTINFVALQAYSNVSAGGYSIIGDKILSFLRVMYPILILLAAINIAYIILRRKSSKHQDTIKTSVIAIITIANVLLITLIVSYFPEEYNATSLGGLDVMKLTLASLLSQLKAAMMMPLYVLMMLPGVIIIFLVERRILSWKYEGTGKERKPAFYAALVSVVISSIPIAYYYSRNLYMIVTPDFAKDPGAKILLHIAAGLVTYIIYRMFAKEVGSKGRGYIGFAAFAISFFLLLSTFYMPIVANKLIINVNANKVILFIE